jgi:hypothetical protein
MNNLELPKGYELAPRMREGEWYDYYLSRGDYGIIGGLTVQPEGVIFDYFKDGELIEYRGATLKDAMAHMTGNFDKAAANE